MPTNSQVVLALYDAFAKGDVETVLDALDPTTEWNEAEGSPYAAGNPYVGPEAIAKGVFERIGREFDQFHFAVARCVDGGDIVVTEGRYHGICKASGKTLDASFAHVWQLRGSLIVRFQQYTDTKQWWDVAKR